MASLAKLVITDLEANKGNPTDMRGPVMLILHHFLDVFPEELPRLPPDPAISFEFELLPGMAPVSKAPY